MVSLKSIVQCVLIDVQHSPNVYMCSATAEREYETPVPIIKATSNMYNKRWETKSATSNKKKKKNKVSHSGVCNYSEPSTPKIFRRYIVVRALCVLSQGWYRL